MPKADKFETGDLVFAKVKGYPPWPARISGLASGQKYKIYFYGTYETSTLKSEDIWFYNEETKSRFGNKYMKKKGYKEGMYQIEHTPDIAAFDDGSFVDSGGNETLPLDEPSVVKKVSPPKTVKRKAEESLDICQPSKKLALSPSVKLFKHSAPVDENSQQGQATKSPSGSPKKGDLHATEGRKLWVKVKDTDDIIEINLDKDRPETFSSEEARQEWETASARKALKFKKKVESGEFVPPEILKRLEERASKSPAEREAWDQDKKLERSKDKLRWLKIEQRLVELDIAVKTSLNLKRPSPDRCIQALEELLELGIAPLMLKKQPDIVSTIRRLRKYVGPHGYLNWTDEEARNKIERSINTIQNKSELIFNKFKDCFLSQDEDDEVFLVNFGKEVSQFNNYIENLDERKVLSMTRDPTKPISSLNPLSDDED
ncbi:hepatoma-derived growth factor-related protein 2 [Eurytemora carolleeae]|uniref:hepatoma-derived growth factor-related protein 2 n=1 Tax=Eurytemora carolleeae TaxID=1294199 RepID=UPI000C773726|nr:hepatoma-derived growth factor-related protein 2 [Eurytemora carolleeae]|eukprot:XP_023344650.1 hepatoma-derived growth factor-related protein 2-like [Eurytemora affinis]